MACSCWGQAGETSAEKKRWNDGLVSLTGQRLFERIKLFREVPGALRNLEPCHQYYEHFIKSSVGNLQKRGLGCSQQQCQGSTMHPFSIVVIFQESVSKEILKVTSWKQERGEWWQQKKFGSNFHKICEEVVWSKKASKFIRWRWSEAESTKLGCFYGNPV